MRAANSKYLAVLEALPGSIVEVMKKSGAGRATVYTWMARLSKLPTDHPDRVYVKRWRRTEGQLSPVYARGDLPSRPKPAAMTNAQYHQRHYQRHRRPLEIELRAAKRAARDNADMMARRRDPLVGALFGSGQAQAAA